jgi:glycosyltransferase involved in cell wall biosynthesis
MDISIAPLEHNTFNEAKSEIKIAECGQYAVPLVGTDCGAYSEWIRNGENGYLIDPEAPVSEWIRVLTSLCKNPKKVKEMGLAMKEISDREFDLNKNVDQRLALYEEMVRGKC